MAKQAKNQSYTHFRVIESEDNQLYTLLRVVTTDAKTRYSSLYNKMGKVFSIDSTGKNKVTAEYRPTENAKSPTSEINFKLENYVLKTQDAKQKTDLDVTFFINNNKLLPQFAKESNLVSRIQDFYQDPAVEELFNVMSDHLTANLKVKTIIFDHRGLDQIS